MLPRQHFVRIIGALVAAGSIAAGAYHYAPSAPPGGGGGASWAGTFDCYGSTPNCTGLSPKTCTSTVAASGLQSALNSATGGEVICVNSGSTGNISLTSKTYTSDVTVQPASTADVAVGNVDLTSVRRLNFTGVGNASGTAATMTMNQLGIGGSTNTNLTFDHITFDSPDGCVSIDSSAGDAAIVFDHNRHDTIEAAGGCTIAGRIGVGGSDLASGWLTITNSHFSGSQPPECSDGIQLDAGGVRVGPGNEFTNLPQNPAAGACTEHVDPVQCFAGPNEVITGNYAHDIDNTGGDSDGNFMCHDSLSNNETFTNNVWQVDVGSNQKNVTFGQGSSGHTVRHNVFFKGITFNNDGSESSGTGSSALDNVFAGSENDVTDDGNVTYTHNLNCTRGGSNCTGTGNITGTPVFLSSPASGYYHYELDPSSPGFDVASDGKSMGICSTCGS